MWKFLALTLLALGANCIDDSFWDHDAVDRYDNYQVYRVMPTTAEAVAELKKLESMDFDFWTELKGPKATVDIMVAPHQRSHFFNILKKFKIYYESFISNVQEKIEDENYSVVQSRESGFSFTQYHRLDVIYGFLNDLAKKYKQVKVVQGGKTYEGRNITGVHVSYKPGNRAIFIEGGIHAREWIAPATTLYLLNELLTSNDTNVRYLAENYDWYFFPSFNPDGYEYTHTNSRLWRKTRKPYGSCHGADPNRNWDAHWLEQGTSDKPCSETYGGSEPFSEVETKSLSQFIDTIGDNLFGYIAYHSYSQLLLIPYGHTSEHLENFDDLFAISKKAVASIKAVHGKTYTPGNIVEVIYPASGGSMDWVKANYKTPITYTYELRDTGLYGFILPARNIIPTGEEMLASLITIVLEAEKLGYK